MNEWYKGDGWYSDGPEISFDYYNAYVIHPMMVEVTEAIKDTPVSYTHLTAGFSFETFATYRSNYHVLVDIYSTTPEDDLFKRYCFHCIRFFE